jgi:Amt family ammonium transporter
VDSGNNAWLLASAAIVMFMVPGLALFYGGMVRAKNVLSTLMHSFFALGIVSILWVLFVYSLAFGPDAGGGIIGNLENAGFAGVGQEDTVSGTGIPDLTFAAFQLMFAILTTALISGAFAERIKFGGYVLFSAIWVTIVYAPLAHWVWGDGGWIGELGALDFAGGTVVHINSGAAALAIALVIGKRRGFGKSAFYAPHNLPLTLLGAGMLWFGWFGFNAGSALAADGIAANAFVVTQVAAGSAVVGWVLIDYLQQRKPTILGAASGAIAGLVAITPCAGFVTPMGSIAIGLIAGVVCALAVSLKYRFGYDDSLDVVGIHMVGGIVGSLLVGLFAAASVDGESSGLFDGGGFEPLGIQIVAVAAAVAFSFILSYVIAWVVDKTVGLRVTAEQEETGLDVSLHAEAGYAFTESGTHTSAPVASSAQASAAKVGSGGES